MDLLMLNLKERRNHLLNQLSGGQQQNMAIGRALLTWGGAGNEKLS